MQNLRAALARFFEVSAQRPREIPGVCEACVAIPVLVVCRIFVELCPAELHRLIIAMVAAGTFVPTMACAAIRAIFWRIPEPPRFGWRMWLLGEKFFEETREFRKYGNWLVVLAYGLASVYFFVEFAALFIRFAHLQLAE